MGPNVKASSTPVPPVQVAPSREFNPGLRTKVPMLTEYYELMRGPGDTLNLTSGKKFREVRDKLDGNVPYVGVVRHSDGTGKATDVRNPNSPDGSWDPYEFMPRFAFDSKEDGFPIAPDFDGDTEIGNNGPETASGKGNYVDGSIGGKQPLSGGFSVTKKGEYTVLTYSFYYAHNKAMDYHQNDYSTAQVYLKPGPDGKLAPSHLMTSWHHGAILTPWKDLEKDADGKPVVKVHLGSHALQPIGKGDSWDTQGLNISGKGEAEVNGKPVGQKLGFDAFQTNVRGARYLDPAAPGSKPRLDAMSWGAAALNPFLPDVFEKAEHPLLQLLKRVGGPLVDKVKNAGEDLADKAKGVAEDVVGTASSVAKKAFGIFR